MVFWKIIFIVVLGDFEDRSTGPWTHNEPTSSGHRFWARPFPYLLRSESASTAASTAASDTKAQERMCDFVHLVGWSVAKEFSGRFFVEDADGKLKWIVPSQSFEHDNIILDAGIAPRKFKETSRPQVPVDSCSSNACFAKHCLQARPQTNLATPLGGFASCVGDAYHSRFHSNVQYV